MQRTRINNSLVYNPCHIKALSLALIKVGEDKVASSWKDSLSAADLVVFQNT
jgi:hypothetical protein